MGTVEVNKRETGQSEAVMPSADVDAWRLVTQQVAQITPQLADLITQFWGVPVHLRFFSASLRNHYYWRQEECHVSQLVLGEAAQSAEPANAALLRISDAACAALLGKVLGPKTASGQKPFRLKQMSPLEANILNDFSRDLLASLMKNLLQKTETVSREQVHLIWTLRIPGTEFDAESGKMILSVPPQCLRLPAEPAPARSGIPESFFAHVKQEVRIAVGRTRLPLSELHQLERGDWVVLEQSDVKRMALIAPETGEALSFSAGIKNQQRLTVPYTQELAQMETQQTARQNLWDNLMIEVNAEFAPVKLPLQQLRQMSEGLVVEVGDLVDNRISLQVEGKTLAWGELIIVGDKFGVRVTQVEAAEPVAGAASTALAPKASGSAASASKDKISPEKNDNDDDLDNFLNDDFDDEDEW